MMFRPQPPRDERELPDRFSFGDIEVDVPTARVWRAGELLHLEPKAFDLLLLLAANRGRIVEKEEIFERIWEGAYVGDNALTRVVSHLRHELANDPDKPSIIETVRTRGYRFLPKAEDVSRPTKEPAVQLRSWRKYGLATLLVTFVVAAAGVVLWNRPGEKGSTASPVPIQITTDLGYSAGPSFSPDGSHIAYTSDAAGGLEIFIRPVEGGQPRQVTTGGGVCIDPAWSPDGRWIAYEDTLKGGVWLVASGGGPTRQITSFGADPAFSPDGRRLVFASRGGPGLGVNDWPAMFDSVLWLVDLPRGEPRQLTEKNATPGGHGTPVFTPDGEWVIFATSWLTGGQLWRVSVNGGDLQALLPPRRNHVLSSPVVTPDGRTVYAVGARTLDVIEEYIFRVQIGRPESVEPVFASAGTAATDLTISPDGRRLAFSVAEVNSRIEEVPLDSSLEISAPPRTLAATRGRVSRPRYSPDGEMLAYSRWRQGARRDLMVVDRGGQVLWNLPDVGGREAITWLTDGDLYVPQARGEVDLVVSVKDRRERELQALPDPETRFPELQPRSLVAGPDRSRLLFTGLADGARELFLWDIRQPRPRKLTRFGQTVGWPAWAPDGEGVVFQVDDAVGVGNELWQLPLDGPPQRVDGGAGPSWSARVSRDGKWVVYAAYRRGAWHLAVAGVEAPERILDVPAETTGYLRYPDWSPSGDRIAYERTTFKSEIYSLTLTGR